MALVPMEYEAGVETGTITKASGIGGTLDFTTCVKKDDVVTVSGRIHSLTNTPAQGVFFNIPQGFRPPSGVFGIGYHMINGVNQTLLPLINTDGTVSCGYSQTSQTAQVAFYATYKI